MLALVVERSGEREAGAGRARKRVKLVFFLFSLTSLERPGKKNEKKKTGPCDHCGW